MNEQSVDKNTSMQTEDLVKITYFTDPLCCWSWAMEPQWRRLRFEYEDLINWSYKMGGMIPDWNSYVDPMNSVSRPIQMGPVWMEAGYKSGMPINSHIWTEDPPENSYMPSIAVKAAALQSPVAEEKYLRKVREAVMMQKKNIARKEVLSELAVLLNSSNPGVLNITQFEEDLKNGNAANAFRSDLQEAKYLNIGRFPTFLLQKAGSRSIIITGYRPYNVLVDALRDLIPDIQPGQIASSRDAYIRHWETITEREINEAIKPATETVTGV